MTDGAARRVRLELDRSPIAARSARRALDTTLRGLVAPRELKSLRLVVSELVNNAVQHVASGGIVLKLSASERRVRGEVHDEGPGFDPRSPRTPAGPAGGFGLMIVDREVTRWGVTAGRSTCVWFECDL